ncbi:MAG: membrane dipeptidase [Chloroflexota bacterium]
MPAPAGLLPMADSHNDLLLGVLHQRERGHADPFGDFWLPQLRAGNVVLQVLPIYTEEQFIGEGALRRALLVIEAARELAALHPDDVAIVETGAQLREAIASGRIALVLAFEGMEPVGSDLAVLDTFFRLGVRIASFTWNRRTAFADGAGENDTGGRLTRLGVAALAHMERIGMVLDVSHLSDAGLWHVADLAKQPFVASHSSCRALRAHPRNLPDEGLRAIAASGGFIGINAFGGFLRETDATVDDFVAHIRHAVEVAGAEHVGLGMDFVDDIFAVMDPILGGVLMPADIPTVPGLKRPADLAGLGVRMTEALGADVARAVAAGSMVDRLAELLP